jgi:hypothetical protein
MKKSQLRHIIRESIKELITEQTNQFPHGGTCSGKTIIPGFILQGGGPNLFDTINQLYGPTANWNDYVYERNESVAQIQWYENPPPGYGPYCIASPTSIYTSFMYVHSVNQPSWCGFNYCGNFQCIIDGFNNVPNSPGTFTTSMTWSQVHTLAVNSGIGGCWPSNFAGHSCSNCDYGWQCKEHWKQMAGLPGKCVPGTYQNPGQFTTKADCISSGCEPLPADVDLEKDITPFTTTPQSIVEPDDEITRMQDLANIK